MSQQNGVALALDSSAYGEAKGLRRGEDIIDALAYIDTISDPEKIAAENLIKEEVRGRNSVTILVCYSCNPSKA